MGVSDGTTIFLVEPDRIDEFWPIDSMSGNVTNGRRLRTICAADAISRISRRHTGDLLAHYRWQVRKSDRVRE